MSSENSKYRFVNLLRNFVEFKEKSDLDEIGDIQHALEYLKLL